MPHALLTAAAPTGRAALRPPPPTAAKPRGTPRRAAIAAARTTHRAARIATRSTRHAARTAAADGQTCAAHSNAASTPPAPRLVLIAPYTGASLLEPEHAAGVAGLCAPAIRPSQGAPRRGPVAPFKPSRIDPLNREPTAEPGSTAPFKPFRTDPLNREPMAKPAPTTPFKPPRIGPLIHAMSRTRAEPGSTPHRSRNHCRRGSVDPLNRSRAGVIGRTRGSVTATFAFKPFARNRSFFLNREPTAKPAPTAPLKPFRTDPLNREPTAKPAPTTPFKPFRTDPLNREPTAKPASPCRLQPILH